MKNVIKKNLIIFFSLILTINANTINNKSVKAQNIYNTGSLYLFSKENQALVNNQTWIKLSNIWKKWNKVEAKVEKNGKKYTELNFKDNVTTTDFNNSNILIEELFNNNCISMDAKDFLLKLFDERYKELKSQESLFNNMPVCYMPSEQTKVQMQSTKSLETRYDLLENLFAENKISKQVYDQSIQQIKNDLIMYRTVDELEKLRKGLKPTGEDDYDVYIDAFTNPDTIIHIDKIKLSPDKEKKTYNDLEEDIYLIDDNGKKEQDIPNKTKELTPEEKIQIETNNKQIKEKISQLKNQTIPNNLLELIILLNK